VLLREVDPATDAILKEHATVPRGTLLRADP
jgi:hypothetical protein